MQQKRKTNPKRVLGLILLGVLVIAAAVLGVRVASLVDMTYVEMRTTPTPEPVAGNVLQVTPDPALPTSAPVLRTGSQGEAVKTLQARLQTLGYYDGEIDGQFGAGTKAAVIAFQRQNGLDADGVVGESTRSTLYSPNAEPYAPAETASPVPTSAVAPFVRADGLPLLVNREQLLPESYQPAELVKVSEVCGPEVATVQDSAMLGERVAVEALKVMLLAAHGNGLTVWQISAGYRTVEKQQALFDEQVREYESKNNLSHADAVSATRLTVADPGASEHHLGLAFDLTVPGAFFKDTEQAAWLAENCWDYGFILRYTKEKEQVTGFLAEPWHIRYVGVEHARVMHEENLCLEEYISRYGRL